MGPSLALLLGLALLAPAQTAPDAASRLDAQLAAVRRRFPEAQPGTPAAEELARDLARIGQGYLD
ncbi:MAG: hypothetical protein ACRD3M_10135, partial [Thermoanaerobaculia bacterium]